MERAEDLHITGMTLTGDQLVQGSRRRAHFEVGPVNQLFNDGKS